MLILYYQHDILMVMEKRNTKARKVAVSTRVDKLEKAVKSMEKTVKSILNDVGVIKMAVGIPTEKSHKIGFASPLKLLEGGVTLYKESGAAEYVEKNKEGLLKHFKNIHEPYDIQQEAVWLLLKGLSKDKGIKNYVFHNAEDTMKDVADVAGIALRDIVFEHKGIDIKKHKD